MDLDDDELLATQISRRYIKKELVKKNYVKKEDIKKILEKYEKRPLDDGMYFYREIKNLLGE